MQEAVSERSEREQVHGRSVTKGFFGRQFHSTGNSSVGWNRRACPGSARYTQSGKRDFCKQSGTGKQAATGPEPKFKHASSHRSWRCWSCLVLLRCGTQTSGRGWLDARSELEGAADLKGSGRRKHTANCRQLSRIALAHGG